MSRWVLVALFAFSGALSLQAWGGSFCAAGGDHGCVAPVLVNEDLLSGEISLAAPPIAQAVAPSPVVFLVFTLRDQPSAPVRRSVSGPSARGPPPTIDA